MAVFYSAQRTDQISTDLVSCVKGAGGRLVAIHNDITLATQTTSDTIELAALPAGFKPLFIALNATATLGSSTIAIGITGATGKYRAAAVFTAAALTMSALPAFADDEPLGAPEVPFITIAAANLPSSGTLQVTFYGVM